MVIGVALDPYTASGEAVVDLTAGLEPFVPFDAEGYHPFGSHQNVWLPAPDAAGWDLDAADGGLVRFVKPDEGAGVFLSCSDTRRDQAEFYPDSLADPDAWFTAEQIRDASRNAAAAQGFDVVDGPHYQRYTIDGHDAMLLRWQQHPTQAEQTAGEDIYAMGLFYIELGDLLEGSDLDPHTVGRCSITATDIDGTGFDEAVDTVLGIRI